MQANDDLVGLDILGPNAEEKILRACRVRLSENPHLDCIHLTFGGDDEVIVEANETVSSLKVKLDKVRSARRT